jgi:hypothetical protein
MHPAIRILGEDIAKMAATHDLEVRLKLLPGGTLFQR